jgi:hypothetical protein
MIALEKPKLARFWRACLQRPGCLQLPLEFGKFSCACPTARRAIKTSKPLIRRLASRPYVRKEQVEKPSD